MRLGPLRPDRVLSIESMMESYAQPVYTEHGHAVRQASALGNRLFLELEFSEERLYDMLKYNGTGGLPWRELMGKQVRLEIEDGYGELAVTNIQEERSVTRMAWRVKVEGIVEWKAMPGMFYTSVSNNTSNNMKWKMSQREYDTFAANDFGTPPKPKKKKTDLDWLNERVDGITQRGRKVLVNG